MAQDIAPLQDVVSAPAAPPPDPVDTTHASDGLLQPGLDALRSVVASRKAELQATTEATTKNNAIIGGLQTQEDAIDQDNVNIMGNLNKIARWGGQNGITKLLGLFDETFNADVQANKLKTNQLKSSIATNQAQRMIDVNNQVPALQKLQTQNSQADFDLQSKALEFTNQARGLDQKDVELNIANTRLKMDQSAEQRLLDDRSLLSMSKAQKQQALAQATAGKGPWAGKQGLLQEALNKEDKAEADLVIIHQDIAKNGLEITKEREDAMTRLVGHLPTSASSALLQNALQAGDTEVKIGNVSIPVGIFASGFNAATDNETKARATVVAQSKAQLDAKLTTTIQAVQSLAALGDPRSKTLSNLLVARSQNYDPNNWEQTRQLDMLVDNISKEAKGIATEVAKTQPTPEARAALETFVQTGKFDLSGGQAVVHGLLGNVAAANSTKYAGAFQIVNNALAKKVADSKPPNMPNFSTGAAGTQAMLAWMLRDKSNTDKIGDFKNEILADPDVGRQVVGAITNRITNASSGALHDAFTQLAKAPNAAPFWAELAAHPETLSQDGKFSLSGLAEKLEQESTKLGPKGPNYNQALVQILSSRAVAARTTPTQDPTATPYDHALEAAFLGGNAEASVLSDFAARLSANAQSAHNAMQQRIQADIKAQGKVQSMANVPGLGEDAANYVMQQGAVQDSATGIPGITSAQIRTLYGGPKPVTPP